MAKKSKSMMKAKTSAKCKCGLTPQTVLALTGLVFTIIALLHVLRVANNWAVFLNGWAIPMWVSYAGIVVAGGLAFASFHAKKHF